MTTVLFAASGSGGHLLPARYIAEALKQQFESHGKQLTVIFIGSGRPLEKKLIEDFGYTVSVVPIHGIASRGIKGILQAVLEYPRAAYSVLKLLRSIKPNAIVGVGGYVSVLPVLLGSLLGIPTVIHEAEVRPGLATKVLSFFATKISVAFAETKLRQQRKLIVAGHPLRIELQQVTSSVGSRKNVLVIGGSQGSKIMDLNVSRIISEFPEVEGVRHQSRPENVEIVKAIYDKAHKTSDVVSFFDDMVVAYSWADIIISRAGAGSVKELEFINKPAILIPLPSVGDHQLDNAKSIERAGHIITVQESDSFESTFRETFGKLLHSQNLNTDSSSGIALPGNALPQSKIAEVIYTLTS